MTGVLRRALQRPESYLGHLRELAGTGICMAMYPFGLLDHGVSHGNVQPAPGLPQTRAAENGRTRTDTPVLLVHGFGHNRSGWTFLAAALRKAGFSQIFTINYNPFARDVPLLAEEVGERVQAIAAATGAERVHVVGHSLGGILLRYYIQLLGGDELVDTAVTIASPHAGTNTARLGVVMPTAIQLLPNSWVIRRLEASAQLSAVRWISYYSNLDVFVQPGSSARLDHPALQATNILVKDHGHLSLLVSPRLTRSVATQLAAADGVAGYGAPVRALPEAAPAPVFSPPGSRPAATRAAIGHPVFDLLDVGADLS